MRYSSPDKNDDNIVKKHKTPYLQRKDKAVCFDSIDYLQLSFHFFVYFLCFGILASA